MSKIIIADTSCLILLYKIGELEILKKLFEKITITPEIKEEFGLEIPNFIKIKPVSDKQKQEVLQTQIDLGEASAIALAMESEDTMLILDDGKARKLADRLSLQFIGTLGLFLLAKRKNIISEVKPMIEKIKATNFRLDENLEKEILRISGEI